MQIAIVNTKGGVGKTTSTIMLATVATTQGHAARVFDADPQGSATEWADMAEADATPLPFEVIPANVKSLKRSNTFDGLTFIDTPPGDANAIEAAISQADVVIIPTGVAPMDMRRTWETIAATSHKRQVILLTAADPQTVLYREARAVFEEEDIAVFEHHIPKREALKQGLGSTPTEFYNYEQIFNELMEAMA